MPKQSEQSSILSDMEQVTGLHQKSLLRLLHTPTLERKKRSKGRGHTCGLAVEQVILVVWECLDYICAERLTPALLSTAQHLARFGSVRLTAEVQGQLEQMSEATVTRLIRKYRSRKQRLLQKTRVAHRCVYVSRPLEEGSRRLIKHPCELEAWMMC